MKNKQWKRPLRNYVPIEVVEVAQNIEYHRHQNQRLNVMDNPIIK
jgi:hypothetical protein